MEDKSIILYHYAFSPYARRIVWYLQLRGIPYSEVRQPVTMPRPDIAALGVQYRRIPIMAIGKDIYCDTRLMLRKLEQLYPENRLGSAEPLGALLEELLERWHVEASLFARAAQSLPSDLPTVKDPKFRKDRENFSGRPWSAEALDKQRPEALVYIRQAFDTLEGFLSRDERKWILGTDQPSLADIQAVWAVNWLIPIPGALPADIISAKTYPRVFSWNARFNSAVKDVQQRRPKPTVLSGDEARQKIQTGLFVDDAVQVAQPDPQQKLKTGDIVELFPTDTGSSCRDRGRLVGLSSDEIVLELDNGLRLHTPRIGFRVRHIDMAEAPKL